MNNDLKGKKLLVLGGSAVNCKFVLIAKSLGIETIVTDINPEAPAKKIADVALPYSVYDIDNIKTYCISNKVDGVANFSNTFSQLSSQTLIRDIGGFGYGDKAAVIQLTEKNAFKSACISHGIDIIPTYSESEVMKGLVEYPIIIKPDDNSGSRGINICNSFEEAVEAIQIAKESSHNGDIVIEKYLENKPDFTVTYYCIDGEPYINRLGDRFLGDKCENLDKTCICTAAPSRYAQLFVHKYHEKFKSMLKDMNIQNGPAFMQGFVDGEKIRFYDPGARFPGGGEYETSLKKATGIDYAEMTVVYAVSGNIERKPLDYEHGYLLNGLKFIQLSFALNPGKIGRIDGVEAIRMLPYVCSATLTHSIGDEILSVSNTSRRFCEVCLLVENNPESILEKVKHVQNLLICDDVDGNSMLAKMVKAEDLL